jgi:hypothetical protein
MIKVNFIIIFFVVTAIILVYGIIQGFYYPDKYSHPDSDEERVQGFLYHFFPELHSGTTEDFYYLLRAGAAIVFVLALLYGLLFKMPIPFVWKPLLVIAS